MHIHKLLLYHRYYMHIKFAIEIFTNCFICKIREDYWSRTFCDIQYISSILNFMHISLNQSQILRIPQMYPTINQPNAMASGHKIPQQTLKFSPIMKYNSILLYSLIAQYCTKLYHFMLCYTSLMSQGEHLPSVVMILS